MSLVTLPNLYAKPADLWDYLGTEGVDLRLDDHNLATGQTVIVTANANQTDTTLAVTPLVFPLLAGTQLEFDGGGMTAVVQAVLTATAKVGDIALTVTPLSGPVNVQAIARDSGVNLAQGQRLVKACSYGTSRVKLYCCPRYDDSALATCWTVNWAATTLGARWLCSRRGQSPPASIANEADEALNILEGVRLGQLQLEDIPTRTSPWPFISNVTVNVGYDYARVRVESPLSEATPTQYGQFIDWNSLLWLQY
jgi:hypothetical protein